LFSHIALPSSLERRCWRRHKTDGCSVLCHCCRTADGRPEPLRTTSAARTQIFVFVFGVGCSGWREHWPSSSAAGVTSQPTGTERVMPRCQPFADVHPCSRTGRRLWRQV